MEREMVMRFFRWEHLRDEGMREMSRKFAELAEHVHSVCPRDPERSVALRKLLEGKDAAVRSLLPKEV